MSCVELRLRRNRQKQEQLESSKQTLLELKELDKRNVLQAQGEAQAITTIDEQLRQSPSYLDWLKSQKWDGQLPLVVGGGAGGGETPFISIPTAGNGSTNITTGAK